MKMKDVEMDFVEDFELTCICILDPVDISKSKNVLLKQKALSSKEAFRKSVKRLRRDKGIKIKEFESLAKKYKVAFDKYQEYKDANPIDISKPFDSKYVEYSKEERKYDKVRDELVKWLEERLTQKDVVSIRDKFRYSPYWDTSIKQYILTNIMPIPDRYRSKWQIVCNKTPYKDTNRVYIQIFGNTTIEDIIEPASWRRIKKYKELLFKHKKRNASKTSIKPTYNKEKKELRIPVYADTSIGEFKYAWTKNDIPKLQKNLPASWMKYAKLYKNFEDDLGVIKRLKKENYEDINEEGGRTNGYNRQAQRKSRMIKRGYVEPYRKNPVQTERHRTCKGCKDYSFCRLDERQRNIRCTSYTPNT